MKKILIVLFVTLLALVACTNVDPAPTAEESAATPPAESPPTNSPVQAATATRPSPTRPTSTLPTAPPAAASPTPEPLSSLPSPAPGWTWYEDPMGRYAISHPQTWSVRPPYNRARFSAPESGSLVIVDIRDVPEGRAWLDWVGDIREALPLAASPAETNATFKGRSAFFHFDPAGGGAGDQVTLLFADDGLLFRLYYQAGVLPPLAAEATIFRAMVESFVRPGVTGASDLPADQPLAPTPAQVTIEASVLETAPDAGVIVLELPAQGFVTVTLAPDGQLLTEDGRTATWEDVTAGAQIRATGEAGPAGTLLTGKVTVPATAPAAAQTTDPLPGLLLAMENSAGGWGLWLVQEDGELRQLVEEIAAPTYLPDFHVSPDGRRVLYAYQGDIWRLDAATGETENVTRTEERLEAAPRWLPGDTERFVAGSFAAGSAGPAAGYLTLIGFDGSYELLDEEGVMGTPPAPSPDGSIIAYSRNGQPFLYYLQGPERGSRPFAPASSGLDWVEGAGEASWSPDGRRLAWTLLGTREEGHQAALLVFDLAANDDQIIHSYTPAGIGGAPQAPLWAPGGDWLAFSPPTFAPEARGLWLADLQGDVRRLTARAPRLTHAPDPALSPDGSRLAFSTEQGDAVGLMTAGEWQPVYWRPPHRVSAAGWLAAATE